MYRGSGKPAQETEFVKVYRRAYYETELTPVEPIVERMEADGGVIGAITVYTHNPATDELVSLRIQQRPSEDHVRLVWSPSKLLGEETLAALTHARWLELRPIEWSEDAKRDCLLAAFAEVIDAIEPAADIGIAASA